MSKGKKGAPPSRREIRDDNRILGSSGYATRFLTWVITNLTESYFLRQVSLRWFYQSVVSVHDWQLDLTSFSDIGVIVDRRRPLHLDPNSCIAQDWRAAITFLVTNIQRMPIS